MKYIVVFDDKTTGVSPPSFYTACRIYESEDALRGELDILYKSIKNPLNFVKVYIITDTVYDNVHLLQMYADKCKEERRQEYLTLKKEFEGE